MSDGTGSHEREASSINRRSVLRKVASGAVALTAAGAAAGTASADHMCWTETSGNECRECCYDTETNVPECESWHYCG